MTLPSFTQSQLKLGAPRNATALTIGVALVVAVAELRVGPVLDERAETGVGLGERQGLEVRRHRRHAGHRTTAAPPPSPPIPPPESTR